MDETWWYALSDPYKEEIFHGMVGFADLSQALEDIRRNLKPGEKVKVDGNWIDDKDLSR